MKILHLDKKSVDVISLRSREALPEDSKTFIEQPTSVFENGMLKIVYCYLEEQLPKLVQALKSISYDKNHRSGGLPTTSRIFGHSPRSTLRKDFCAVTSMSQQFPEQHAEICKGATVVSKLYEQFNPILYKQHDQTSKDKVRREWHLEDSPFTSGVANKDNQLRYHFDSGNFLDVWSAMLVFKNKMEGGYLSVPEYDLCFELKDHSCLMFDGQGLLHGVTPFKKLSLDAYRYSIVYYSLRQMWNCLSPSDELLRIRELKTKREYKRAGLA